MTTSLSSWDGRPISCRMEYKSSVGNIRTYDEDGFKQRSACLCFRDGSEQEVLLVTSSSDPQCWVVPGGGVEPQESPCCAARRELQEEAGAIGAVHRFVGVFTENEKNEMRKTKTYVFTLNLNSLVDQYEDNERIGRRRKWFSLEDAQRELRARPASLHYLVEALNSATAATAVARSPHRDVSAHQIGNHFPCAPCCDRPDGNGSTWLANSSNSSRDRTIRTSPCKCGYRKQKQRERDEPTPNPSSPSR